MPASIEDSIKLVVEDSIKLVVCPPHALPRAARPQGRHLLSIFVSALRYEYLLYAVYEYLLYTYI